MGTNFKIDKKQIIIFPNKCIICGKFPVTEYKISGRSVSGGKFSSAPIKKNKIAFKLRVCLKHYYLIMLMRILSVISFISTVIFAAPIVFSTLDLIVAHKYLLEKCYIFSCFSLIIFIISIMISRPVRIKKIGKYNYTLSIRNDEYANDFSLANSMYCPEID